MNSNSDEFEAKKSALYAKFQSLKHVVDYYFAIKEKELPEARYAGNGSQYDLIGVDKFSESDYQALCRHLACDDVHYSVLLDVETILNRESPDSCKYAYVFMQCMFRLRSSGVNYYPEVHGVSRDTQKLLDSKWFVDVPH